MDKTQILAISEALAMTENIPEIFAKLLELQDEGYLTVEMGIKDGKPFLTPIEKNNPTSTSVHVPSTSWNRDEKIIVKAFNDEQRYTLSPWYIPQSVDAHGEWTDRDEVQQAFWKYLAQDNRDIRLQHNLEIVAGKWVEGLTWPVEVKMPVKHPDGKKEYTFPAGTPFLGVVWQPWAWELIKSGDLRGLSIGGKAQRFDEEMGDDDYEPMGKVDFYKTDKSPLYKESYSPPKAVQTNAKRALNWIEDGKAGSGFTSVGRRRANQLANGDNVSLRTLARIKSFLSRHQDDKKAVGFDYGEKNFPSAGRVAYDAWGGDEALRWASNILDRIEKHGDHDQSTHAGGRGGRARQSSRRARAMESGQTKRPLARDADGRVINTFATGGYKADIPESIDFGGENLTPEHSLWHHLESDGEGGFRVTAERQEVHNKIISDAVKDVPVSSDPTFHMLGGGPAAGKSTAVRSGLANVPDKKLAVHVNADDIKEGLPEYNLMKESADDSDFFNAASFAHEESSMLAKRTMRTGLENNQDVVLDGTGDGSLKSVENKIYDARNRGYKVNAVYATVPTQMAVDRSNARALKAGENRFVPTSIVTGTHRDVSRIFPEITSRGLFDSVTLVDTQEFETPRVLATGDRDGLTIINEAGYSEFLAKGDA